MASVNWEKADLLIYFDPYLCACVCIFLSQPSIYIHMTYLHWKPPVLHSIHAVSGVKGQTWEYTSTCSGESKAFLLNPGCMWIRIEDPHIYSAELHTDPLHLYTNTYRILYILRWSIMAPLLLLPLKATKFSHTARAACRCFKSRRGRLGVNVYNTNTMTECGRGVLKGAHCSRVVRAARRKHG